MSVCFCGICIPYTAIVPLVLFIVKPIWEFIQKIFGWEKEVTSSTKTGDCSNSCKSCNQDSTSSLFSTSNSITYEDNMDWESIIKTDKCCVRLTAPWCKPCKKLEPFFDTLVDKYKTTNFVSVDIDAHDGVAAKCQVLGIPHFQFYRNGELVETVTGDNKTALEEMISKYS
jgi:thioredoxin 1